MKVLIVEDEIRIREGIVKLLQKIDGRYEVVGEAENGAEGVALCEELHPQLIITDVQMPEMDGLMMLQEISRRMEMPKTIVLSAYSEFEYARSAMKLGVTEYLLKPINLNDFSQALGSIEHQLAEDRQRKPLQIGTLEQVFREIIGGRLSVTEEIADYLDKNYRIRRDETYVILLTYLGNQYSAAAPGYKKKLDHSLSLYPGIDFCSMEEEYRRSVYTIVYHLENRQDFERWIQHQLLRQMSAESVVGFIEAESLESLPTAVERLFPYMDWNISFENNVLISYPKITQVKTSLCVYPKELETHLKAMICSSDLDRTEADIRKFEEYFLDGRVYDPREIKECYVRFIWSALEMAKDVGNHRAGEIKQQKLLEQIMGARMQEELAEICDMVAEVLRFHDDEADSTNLIVKRAKSMIHEFYHSGITLDEIAARLNITPEYLGTQFHRETGTTFSSYIRNYRIAKAKELLVGTSLKLYEIAERVGYADPKYFSKVFRDVTGQLPAEYRKTAK
ncbi:MAG: response regulator [Lachnospiraceae bacterium]|nr:response regulator [Lachnospiraceae bacterium]